MRSPYVDFEEKMIITLIEILIMQHINIYLVENKVLLLEIVFPSPLFISCQCCDLAPKWQRRLAVRLLRFVSYNSISNILIDDTSKEI